MIEAIQMLVVYSNPITTSRLRLDREHRAIEQIIEQHRLGPDRIRRLHATDVRDLTRALRDVHYEVVVFSGHGSEQGIVLEGTSTAEPPTVLDPGRIAAALRAAAGPPRVLVFLACYSSSALQELVTVSPFLITVSGPADDDACIEFSAAFIDAYFESGAVEYAFEVASARLEVLGKDSLMNPVLSRRALVGANEVALVVPAWEGRSKFAADRLVIDLSEVETNLEPLGTTSEYFRSLVSRKLRTHHPFFNREQEYALLSVGEFFAEFSWLGPDDRIVCHRVLSLRHETTELLAQLWYHLVLWYNDLSRLPYRASTDPAGPGAERRLKKAVRSHQNLAETFFNDGEGANELRNAMPQEFKLAAARVPSSTRMAEYALAGEDSANAVFHLESSLTAIHDFVRALTDRVAISSSTPDPS